MNPTTTDEPTDRETIPARPCRALPNLASSYETPPPSYHKHTRDRSRAHHCPTRELLLADHPHLTEDWGWPNEPP